MSDARKLTDAEAAVARAHLSALDAAYQELGRLRMAWWTGGVPEPRAEIAKVQAVEQAAAKMQTLLAALCKAHAVGLDARQWQFDVQGMQFVKLKPPAEDLAPRREAD